MSQSNSESDIWEYKSLKKTKKQDRSNSSEHAAKRQRVVKQGASKKNSDQNIKENRVSNNKRSNVESKARTRSTTRNQLPSQSGQAVSVNGSLTSSSHPASSVSHDIHDDISHESDAQRETGSETGAYCPVCQMPFSVLVVQSQRWHVAECLETPGETSKECPDGLQCSSSIPNHYKRYSHSLLAHCRAVNSTDTSASALGATAPHLEQMLVKSEDTISSKDSSVDSALNLSSVSSHSASPGHGSRGPHTPVRPNALLLLRSPAPEDIKKKKGWSPSTKGSRAQTSSQEAKITVSTPIKAESSCHAVKTVEIKEEPSALNDDDYISYSPLSELPAEMNLTQTKKKLFHSTALDEIDEEEDENDSLMLFDDTVSDDDLLSDILDQYEIEKTQSQGGLLVMESPYTCDQLDSLEPHEHLTSSSSAGAADGPNQFSSPVRHSKDEHLVIDCEGSSDKPQLQSNGSLVLERLRERISNPADSNSLGFTSADINSVSVKQEISSTQAAMSATQNKSVPVTPRKAQTKASGLKQTDIGVFFGLKPLSKKAEAEVNATKEEGLQVRSTLAKRSTTAGENAKRQGRQRRKNTAMSEESTVTEAAEEGAAQPTQTEGGRGVRAGGRKRWNRGRATDGGPVEPKRCPFYKKIPGTGFAVDAFQYGTVEGITAYFLTHFHSDHYGGLNKKSTLPVYCNKITGNLVKSKLKVDEQYVHVLPMNTECMVDGMKVILLDSNHCPGAAMLLFLLPDGQTVLHTGDFRADPSMERYPELQGLRIQTLYLDTTYCSPEYTFPTQQEVITFAANTAFELVTLNPRTLVVCGTYAVGKEKVFLAVSQVLGSKVYMSRDRYNTMCCLELEQIHQCFTTDSKAARVHVLPMMQLNFKNLKTHLNKFSESYDQLVAFKPTGWTFTQSGDVNNIQPEVKDDISIYGIPYSEHSSYLELKRFVQWLQPLKIIPTVNVGSWSSRKAMEKYFREWQAEVKALNTVPRNSCSRSYTRQ
ncbi:DNA cross-link repair 1A protein [Colossoma macropomum]|uniref:DNA cross-link repair 1A protein n=1 Tax=Colossoma macropomum TaxID=42526 RepID=UPI001864860D|nr:DNA cross-link repair 1A protein [Colossoma macropomum]